MNIILYSKFRLFFWILFLFCFLSWGGFVSMQNQLIAFYEEPFVYDTLQDSSFQKYLGNWYTLQDTSYKPTDLFSIPSDFCANNSKRFLLRKDTAEKFADLARHFRNDNDWAKLYITSTYRSASFQSTLLKNWCSRSRCAEAWSSEHQLGLAIDLWVQTKWWKYIPLSKSSEYYQRLVQKWADFWFHNTYQKWIDIDGQMDEPWHRRYLWENLAQTLRDKNMSFSQRVSSQQEPDYLRFN